SGNIGFPFVTAAKRSRANQELVCEVSSFQLEYTDTFRPAVALVTNVAPDHLDWHESYRAYLAAKAKITANQTADDLLIVAAGDEGGSNIAESSKARIALFGLRPPDELRESAAAGMLAETVAGIDGDAVIVEQDGERSELMSVADIRVTGAHNLENVMAACLAGRERGVAPDAIAEAVSSFEGLPHRGRLVAEIKGVHYIDDSKATNPAAAIAACRGLERVILIAGGRAKGLDLTALNETRPSLKAVVVMGESARQMARVFDGVRCYSADWVEDAVDVAAGLAREGDTVLLSPGCSSLDQYQSYAERGDRFAARVKQLEH
ncbi:MAG: UDP-N-acetylmuramoyl-L-alanine--D-glutamate ligase, partial [Actinomycetota bacterium]